MASRRATRLVRTALAAVIATLFAPAALAQLFPEISSGAPGNFSGIGGFVAPGGGGGAKGSSVLPGVRTTLTVSDNLRRGTGGGEEAGYRLEVSPYVSASASNNRFQGTLNYTMRAGYSSVSNDNFSNALRHTLNARGNALLIGDWLGIAGSANTFFTNTSPFGALSQDPTSSRINTSRVSTFSVTPYVRGQLGSFANYRAQYTLTRTEVSGGTGTSNLLGRQSEQLLASLSSGPQFNRWGWSFQSGATTRSFANGLSLDSTSNTASLFYVFSPELRLGVSATHLSIDRLTDRSGNTSGWGPGVSVDWSPNRRTSLRMNLAEQYYGNTAAVSFAHRGTRWSFGLNYNKAVFSSNNAGILSMNLANLLAGDAYSANLNPIFRQLAELGVINPEDIILGAGILNDALVRTNSLRATLGYVLPRGALSLSAFRSERATLLDSTVFLPASDPLVLSSFGRFETRGISLNGSMPLDARTSVRVSGTTSQVKSLDRPDSARISTVIATVSSKLDAKTTVSAGVRRTVQGSVQGGVSGYDENAIFGTLDVRF